MLWCRCVCGMLEHPFYRPVITVNQSKIIQGQRRPRLAGQQGGQPPKKKRNAANSEPLEAGKWIDRRASDHILDRFPLRANGTRPSRACRTCYNKVKLEHGSKIASKRKRQTVYFCSTCPGMKAMCKDCFKEHNASASA
jgi:hypothetical protein